MALPAAPEPAGQPARWGAARLLRLLAPYPGRLEFSVRLALICALTALVTEIYQTPDPALTVYVAFFVIKPDRVSSVIVSLIMVMVMTVTITITLLATIAVADQPMWRVTAMALLSFGLIFLGSASKLRPFAPIVALIAAYALDLLGTVRIGEIATRGLLYAWLFVAIPAGVSIVVNILLGPAPRRLAERALAQRLSLAAAMLQGPSEPTRRAFQATLRRGVHDILGWVKLTGMEKTAPAADLAALRQAAASTMQIMLLADLADRAPERALPPAAAGLIAERLRAMAAILRKGGYPVEIELPVAQLDTPLESAMFATLREALIHFAVPPAPAAPPAPAPAKKRGSLLVPDAFSNPAHVQHALKTTAAAMFCYILYSLLNWPTIHTCLITCYIVGLGTAAETVEKLSLRLLGCIIGAATGIAAIVFLVPALTSIGGLMITVFLASLAAAWVAAGDARIAYAGFQIAFAFFLCVIQGSGPSFDMVTARDRIIGILLGNVVVYVIFTKLWPVSVVNRIGPGITALLRKFGAMLTAGNKGAALAASEAQAALVALERDLDLAAYEPASIRPGSDWLSLRRAAADDITALAGVVMLTAAQDPQLSRDMAGRLAQLADGAKAAPAQEEEAPASAASPLGGLRGWIEARLDRLERLQHQAEDKSKIHAST
ncbi:MAG TPA: FUSC family protein [Acidocella sp.]|nr:FUSC family protein [Acidocella sp.]